MAGYDISTSSSAAADSGKTGAFNVNTGGGKQSMTLYIVGGIVLVIALVVWLKRGK